MTSAADLGLTFPGACDLCAGRGDVGDAPCPSCARRVRETLLRGLRATVAGTLRALDDQATFAIECAKPLYVSTEAVHRALAFRWLKRPRAFWARVWWAIRLVRGAS